jgi:hypothetical protein
VTNKENCELLLHLLLHREYRNGKSYTEILKEYDLALEKYYEEKQELK